MITGAELATGKLTDARRHTQKSLLHTQTIPFHYVHI